MTAQEFNKATLPLSGRIYRLAWKFLQDQDDAKDAVQEIFIKLWNMRDQIKEINSVEAFAVRITRNHCLDVLKKHHTVRVDQFESLGNRFSHDDDPSRLLVRQESVKLVHEIIRSLPEPQRSVILYRDVEGYEPEEICKMLDINDGNLRVMLSRARKKVREEFEKLFQHGAKTNRSIVAEIL